LSLGSGIPEIKSFLNGINLRRVLRIRTFFAKFLGTIFCVAGGFPVGKQGPMVHCGAIIGAGISQGKSVTLGFDTSWSKFQSLRNDISKRDFVICGAACGVAAAFSAPLGGVMFGLEEGASFWRDAITWRSFVSAAITLLTLFVLKRADDDWDNASTVSVFSFGTFSDDDSPNSLFAVWELPIFACVGILGGLFGAFFNHVVLGLLRKRQLKIGDSYSKKFLEVVILSLSISTIMFLVCFLWKEINGCSQKPTNIADWTSQQRDLIDNLQTFGCGSDSKYNQLASLFMVKPDIAIKQLFHSQDDSDDDSAIFSSASLLCFLILYAIMSMVSYGASVPAGLFVPCLMMGACYGRLIGHVLSSFSNDFANSGTYAFIGAASMLGGVNRMAIFLSVVLLEATGSMQFTLPLMVALTASKYVGDMINGGIYSLIIGWKRMPFLKEEEDDDRMKVLSLFPISQIMKRDVITLCPLMKIEDIVHIVGTYPHHSFPIVNSREEQKFIGVVSRHTLVRVIQLLSIEYEENDFTINTDQNRSSQFRGTDTLSSVVKKIEGDKEIVNDDFIDFELLHKHYPRYLDDISFTIPITILSLYLSISSYNRDSSISILEQTSVLHSIKIFRVLGLRCLTITNRENEVTGLVTRHELNHSNLKTYNWSHQTTETSLTDHIYQTGTLNPLSSRSSIPFSNNENNHVEL